MNSNPQKDENIVKKWLNIIIEMAVRSIELQGRELAVYEKV